MTERSPGAHMVRRRLGSGLRKLREDANIRIQAAARELECSPAKISRLENGHGPAKLWDVRILLSFYGVEDPDLRQTYEDWARGTKSESWWESDADLFSDNLDQYFAAETVAKRVRIFCPPALPALLRTADYTAAHIRIMYPSWPQRDMRRVVLIQQERQAQLLRPDHPLTFEAIIDEAAILRRVGTAAIHLAQLERLADLLSEQIAGVRPNLNLRIIPLTSGPGRISSPFTIFDPRDADLDPVTAFVEEIADNGTWIDPVGDLLEIYDELYALSVDAEDSLSILRTAVAARSSTPSGHRVVPDS